MAAHRYHPDPTRLEDDAAIFFDDCEECTRQAKEPVYHLDQYKMRKLWNRMLDVEVADTGMYLSHNEATACRNLWPVYIFLERFTDHRPKTMRVGLPTL